jgi:hypothetical protein
VGNNYQTGYSNTIPKTTFTKTSMDIPLSLLDQAITYHKAAIMQMDGYITYTLGTTTLAWAGEIRIHFAKGDGSPAYNIISAGNVSIPAGSFAYVLLNETNGTDLTVHTSPLTTNPIPFVPYNAVVIGHVASDTNNFFPSPHFAGSYWEGTTQNTFVSKTSYDANSILAATADNTPMVLTIAEQRIVGRKTGGDIDDLTGADVLAICNGMQAGQQEITSDTTVTIDWSLGSTAYMTFDDASVAVTFTNPVAGQVYRLLAIQNAGSQVFTWTTTVKWRGGSAPTLSTAAGARDILTFVYINGAWYGDIAAAFA